MSGCLDGGVPDYAIGGWTPPYGIEYAVDPLSAMVTLLVSFIAAMVVTGSGPSINDQVSANKQTLFYATYLLCLAGLLGMTLTGDLFNVFVFLEISSLSSYALIALGPTRRAPLAALQYLIVGTIGATFFLIGIGLLYQMTGTLNMEDLSQRLPVEEAPRTLLVALAMMSVGLAIKMAVFPVHTWLPAAYAASPDSVTAFLAATSTKVSIYAFIRLVFTIFSGRFAFDMLPLDSELMFLALLGVFVASVGAIFQTDLKRVLAYSSIAQVGYILFGVSIGSVEGLAAAIAHMMHHGLIKGGLFMAIMAVVVGLRSRSSGTKNRLTTDASKRGITDWTSIERFEGLGRTSPLLALLIVLGLLGLIGVPLTAGFVSKWMLVSAALQLGSPIGAALVLIASLLAVAYSWRIVETMFFMPPSDTSTDSVVGYRTPTVMFVCTAGLTLLPFVFGTYPLIARWSTIAARQLLGAG